MKIAPLLGGALFILIVIVGVLVYRKEGYCGYCSRDNDNERLRYAAEFVPQMPTTAWTISNVANDAIATLHNKDGDMINNITCSSPGGLILGHTLLESKLEDDRFSCLYSTNNDNVLIKYSIQPYNDQCSVMPSGAMKCQFWPSRSCPNPTTLQVSCSALKN